MKVKIIETGKMIEIDKDDLKFRHRLMCGDSTNNNDVNLLVGRNNYVDLLLTDPPYGVDYSAKNDFLNKIDKGNLIQETIVNDNKSLDEMKELWTKSFINANKVMKEGASYYINSMQGGDLLLLLSSLKEAKLELKQSIVWVKNNHVLGRSDYNYKHELIIYGWKKGKKHNFYNKFDVSVWEVPKPSKSDLHPTMKPIKLISKAIKNSSKEKQIILDLFGGSGSTIIACEQLKRKCYMMEIDPTYCQVIINRWEELTRKKAIKIANKKIIEE